jgi:hypothetical protein
MAEQQARVTSVEAIESFRASLIVFTAKGRPAVEEVFGECARVRHWVETGQRGHWDRELRVRHLKLEEARQELFSAKLSRMEQPSAAQHLAVQRAQRAVDEAETKRRMVKKWSQHLDHEIQPLLKQLEQLLSLLVSETPKAVQYLAQTVKTLEDYASVSSHPAVITDGPAATQVPATENTASPQSNPQTSGEGVA